MNEMCSIRTLFNKIDYFRAKIDYILSPTNRRSHVEAENIQFTDAITTTDFKYFETGVVLM